MGESGDGMLLEHGGSVIAFSGAAARRLLPALLPLLDGTRSVDEIVEIVGPPVAAAVENALELLADQGLLTQGSDDLDVVQSVRATRGLLRGRDPVATARGRACRATRRRPCGRCRRR